MRGRRGEGSRALARPQARARARAPARAPARSRAARPRARAPAPARPRARSPARPRARAPARPHARTPVWEVDAITIPPTDPVGRMNFCKAGETHMWRKKSEAALPELAGDDMYSKQAPIERCIPMWGGISSDGMAPILCHPTKKVCADDWAACVDNG
jgi:hypothetical protein